MTQSVEDRLNQLLGFPAYPTYLFLRNYKLIKEVRYRYIQQRSSIPIPCGLLIKTLLITKELIQISRGTEVFQFGRGKFTLSKLGLGNSILSRIIWER